MAGNYSKTSQLLTAVARVTGVKGADSNEGVRFRVVVTSSDGHKAGVTAQVNNHGAEVKGYQLGQLARKWHLDRKGLLHALENWGPDDLRAHLESLTREKLREGQAR